MSFNSATEKLLNAALVKRLPLRKMTNAIRLINGVGDRLDGLVLEQYDRHFVAQIFDPSWLIHERNLADFLTSQFAVDYFIVKDRTMSASSNPDQIKFKEVIQRSGSRTLVKENGLQFEVDLNDTLNTGLFLDMRANRHLVGRCCQSGRMLNCFAYTCSFGVYAKYFGAQQTVNVDVSKKILEKGARNYQLNQMDTQSQELIKADAVDYLEKAVKKQNCFDVIVLDPPSFSRLGSKAFSVERDMAKLIQLATQVLTAQGKLFVSTNYSSMTAAKLEKLVKANTQGRVFKRLTQLGQDQDFVGSGLVKESHLAAVWAES